MVPTAADMIDRRRLRRKLGFWRIAAVLALALALVAALMPFRAGGGRLGTDQIARVAIEGMILEDEKLVELLDDLREDPAVRGVILKIDSPGGTTVGGETLYHAVRKLAAAKPVAAEVGTLAASAAYLVAVATDQIVAKHTSIVGSIGVIFQYVDASKLLGTVGVDVKSIKSSPLKAEPSPFAPAPEEAKAMVLRVVMNTYEWFVRLVSERRPLKPEEVRTLADGSVFSGEQGLANKLVDRLGGEDEVRAWLEGSRNVPKGLEIVDREPEDEDEFSLFAGSRAALFGLFGLDPEAKSLPDALRREAGNLDGLVSLWQPAAN
ncbi:signal peptide peptidase SppA [Mangrovicella endophytica]|uniref:signal peptide peptidase SppA n=1 Tax=Mangrovicella endophytica TaxID=2066697 RepID=UPI000C9E408A|nr:signal peptide peptidase SppA [Mangrovicella endophytica]